MSPTAQFVEIWLTMPDVRPRTLHFSVIKYVLLVHVYLMVLDPVGETGGTLQKCAQKHLCWFQGSKKKLEISFTNI
jgi:hypothetical protein